MKPPEVVAECFIVHHAEPKSNWSLTPILPLSSLVYALTHAAIGIYFDTCQEGEVYAFANRPSWEE